MLTNIADLNEAISCESCIESIAVFLFKSSITYNMSLRGLKRDCKHKRAYFDKKENSRQKRQNAPGSAFIIDDPKLTPKT